MIAYGNPTTLRRLESSQSFALAAFLMPSKSTTLIIVGTFLRDRSALMSNSYHPYHKTLNKFKNSKKNGIIKGFLLGFLLVGLYFYPFVPREEALTDSIGKWPDYFTVFWDFTRVILLICWEIGIFLYYLYLSEFIEQYQTKEDLDAQDMKEVTSVYMCLGGLTVILAALAVLIINVIANLSTTLNNQYSYIIF